MTAALLLLAGCAPAETVTLDLPAQTDGDIPADTAQQLQDAVTAAMTATGATGAIVGVWAPWSGTWVTGLGTTSPGGAAVETDMVFRAADVTRGMTCDLLYQAAAAEQLALDDSVTEWVNGFPDLEGITLQQLCDGTAGFGSFAPQLQDQWYANPSRVWNPSELASYGVGQDEGEPGTGYADSDAGYVLLGLALERATGQSMDDLIAERIAQPLALTQTSLPGDAPAPPSTTAPVLDGLWSVPDADGVWNCTDPTDRTEISASLGASDSGAVTDITDLGRYTQSLATAALSPDAGRYDAPLPVAGEQTWLTAAGGAFQAGSLIGQYGSVPGYMTAAFADPNTGLTVAVVLNNSGADSRIAAWLAWELAALASRAPAAAGQSIPEAGLPWTAQQMHDQIAANAICAAPAS